LTAGEGEGYQYRFIEKERSVNSMEKGRSGCGTTKHGKSGTVHGQKHFTGKKGGKKVRRKGHIHRKKGAHINKYEDLR
jgi:hypothetical protein